MKLILLIIIGLVVFYFGYLFSIYYSKQLLIYKDVVKFCEVLTSQIKFKQNSLKQIVKENLNLFNSEFKQYLISYFIDNNKNFKSNYLKDFDLNQIKNFFNSLGNLDVEGEIKNIENQKIVLSLTLNEISEKEKKFGPLGKKLGALLGILIYIIFI